METQNYIHVHLELSYVPLCYVYHFSAVQLNRTCYVPESEGTRLPCCCDLYSYYLSFPTVRAPQVKSGVNSDYSGMLVAARTGCGKDPDV